MSSSRHLVITNFYDDSTEGLNKQLKRFTKSLDETDSIDEIQFAMEYYEGTGKKFACQIQFTTLSLNDDDFPMTYE